LPETGAFEAKKIAERCRQEISKTTCCEINVTNSFGISGIVNNVSNGDELVNQADEALYTSKNSGRNCVTLWKPKSNSISTQKI